MILASGAYWVSAGSYCFDSFCCGFGFAEGGWPGLVPAGEVLFFASPKKSTQKKGDPQSATPALRYGANLRRGSWAGTLPSGCAEECSGQRIRARDCLSAAGASSSETPLAASTAGCPQRSGGTHPAGSPFLCLLSFGEAKESESPAGARPGLHPHQKHKISYKKHSYSRNISKRQSQIRS